MKRMLADVLWMAANTYLKDGDFRGFYQESCCAAFEAELPGVLDEWVSWHEVSKKSVAVQFMRSLGCRTGANGFQKYKEGEERQGVRYMWLLLAMHVAEDEGIEL